MKVRKYQDSDFDSLFAYWQKLGERIPYFFPVTADKWHDCMFADKLEDEKKFLFQQTFVAAENDQIVGFIQGVRPAFAWNEKGEKYQNAPIGILRHFYYAEGRKDVADQLFDSIESCLNQFQQQHAFYHIFGMSCNAHHGKLHESLWHVEAYLLGRGFELEHENVYYGLELKQGQTGKLHDLLVKKTNHQTNAQEYEIVAGNQGIGGLHLRFLDKLTGGRTKDTVYLTWLMINKENRRQGWARQALKFLVNDLQSLGYRYLHTDTTRENLAAQRLYESLGFVNLGGTRSYISK